MSEVALHLRAWRAYFESSARLMSELEASLKRETDMDLADFNVLLVLSEAEGKRMRMGELARRIVFAPGRLTYRSRVLQDRGWIQRSECTIDGRGVEAVLTEAGERQLRKARPAHARHIEQEFLGSLSEAQLAALDDIFTPLRARLLD